MFSGQTALKTNIWIQKSGLGARKVAHDIALAYHVQAPSFNPQYKNVKFQTLKKIITIKKLKPVSTSADP